jgi:hypothetical protein
MAAKTLDDQIAIAGIQKDIEYIRASISEMKSLLSVFATKQELAASMKEVEGLVYNVERKFKAEIAPIAEDMQSRKSDRRRMLWYVVGAFLASTGGLLFALVKDYIIR